MAVYEVVRTTLAIKQEMERWRNRTEEKNSKESTPPDIPRHSLCLGRFVVVLPFNSDS